MATDINVEALHQKRQHSILYGTPFGSHFSLENDSWSDLYKLVCHINYAKKGWIDKRRRMTVDPVTKLEVALLMRGEANWSFKFRPQHIIHDELCMVLQERAFRIDSQLLPVEIPQHSYTASNQSHIFVREIAFGPDEDPTVRTVGLWFNIDERDVLVCTSQQAKRFRWKRGVNIKDDSQQTGKSSAFETLDHFPMIRPHDRETFGFTTSLLKHRLRVVRAERICSMRGRFDALQKLEGDKQVLYKRFLNLAHCWKVWLWPINDGRASVDKHTPVPPVDGKYEFGRTASNLTRLNSKLEETSAPIWHTVNEIWESFVSAEFQGKSSLFIIQVEERVLLNVRLTSSKRLRPFLQLAQGKPLSLDRRSPHILKHDRTTEENHPSHSQDQDRCWKSLLLTSGKSIENSEWELVEQHFKNSRSNKVLNIIQDKTA